MGDDGSGIYSQDNFFTVNSIQEVIMPTYHILWPHYLFSNCCFDVNTRLAEKNMVEERKPIREKLTATEVEERNRILLRLQQTGELERCVIKGVIHI